MFLLQNRILSKSTDSVKYISSKEKDITDNTIQSEMSKQDIDIGSELEENVKELIEENESLRKGMHEILDSIHNQDGIIYCIYIFLRNICILIIKGYKS